MDMSRIFVTATESVQVFFRHQATAYYIPMYQREYSWDRENIYQLIDDICIGVNDLLNDSSEDAIHFMGNLILVQEQSKEQNICPLDSRALPTQVDSVIDGQQRISTIALLSCQLYERISTIYNKLPKRSDFRSGLEETFHAYCKELKEIFSVDLDRGSPRRKPIIIRALSDEWTFDGDDSKYSSDTASYIAKFIRSTDEDSTNSAKIRFPALPSDPRVGTNLKRIKELLIEYVEKAHLSRGRDRVDYLSYPAAWEILHSKLREEDLWSYPRPKIVEQVEKLNQEGEVLSNEHSHLCSLIQLFSFCHYLLQRCCFTIIRPKSDTRAFDMFQSLNATGTPLTPFETFKPVVVSHVESQVEDDHYHKGSKQQKYLGSKSQEYLKPVDDLLRPQKNDADKKTKLTNEFLITFALTNNGHKLPKQFSAQRKWLKQTYDSYSSSEKENFLQRMGHIATYYSEIAKFSSSSRLYIEGIQGDLESRDRELAEVCILYLQKANHKMSNTILGRFFSETLRDIPQAGANFISACKAIAAFYTLWRSGFENTGLDDIYRKLLNLEDISWDKEGNVLTLKVVKEYFRQVLADKVLAVKQSEKFQFLNLKKDNSRDKMQMRDVEDYFRERLAGKETETIKKDWMIISIRNLTYEKSSICRFVLLATSEDTIPDQDQPGLMKSGALRSTPTYLTVENWCSKEMNIEHIAPKQRTPEWDAEIYEDGHHSRIGNLTLLSGSANSSMGNKGWRDKQLYYKLLSENDPLAAGSRVKEAKRKNPNLDEGILQLLQSSPTSHHIQSIITLGEDGNWNKNIIEDRSERICSILWDRLYSWLE